MKKIIPLILSLFILSGCTVTPDTNAPIAETTETTETTSATTTPAVSETEETITRMPSEVDEFSVKCVEEFFSALKSKNKEKIYELSEATKGSSTGNYEGSVEYWLDKTTLSSYKILGSYAETTENKQVGFYTRYYVLVEADFSETFQCVFKEGKNLYRVYLDGGAVLFGRIVPDGEEYIDYHGDAIVNLCTKYDVYYGRDFSGDYSVLFDRKTPLVTLKEFAWVNHDDISSMEDLTKAVEDNIGLSDVEWDNTIQSKYYKDYERIPRGGKWHTYKVEEYSKERCVITYYADTMGIMKAYTVEYHLSENENKTPRIVSAKKTGTTGFSATVNSI